MKHIVTKRNYKVGACAMALALLMATAGGAVVNAEQRLNSPVGFEQRDEVLLEIKGPKQSFNEGGVGNLESINQTPMASSGQKSSWFGSFWGGVKTFWNALCCSVGLTGLKVSK
ncbi:TPA: SSU0592/SSU0593 family protein [Streptococcus suis]